jgi:hypothetical protein
MQQDASNVKKQNGTVCMAVTSWVNYTMYIEVLKHFWLPCGAKARKVEE